MQRSRKVRQIVKLLPLLATLIVWSARSDAESLSVSPPIPTVADVITIAIDGRAPISPSTPYVRDVSVNGQLIKINECFGVPAFFSIGTYHDVATMGQLHAGRYTVELHYQVCDHVGTIITPLGLVATAQFSVGPATIPALTGVGHVLILFIVGVAFVVTLRQRQRSET